MKKPVLLALMFMFTMMLNAQITLEHTFPNTPYAAICNLEEAGEKWFIQDIPNNKFYLYNLDYTLFKEIAIPVQPDNQFAVGYVSDKLFDLDASLEFMILDYHQARVDIYNEDGSLLFTAGDNLIKAQANLLNTNDGAKMEVLFTTIATWESNIHIYSLPGKLLDISQEPGTSILERNIVQVFPNPNNGLTRLNYNLLPGETQGKISFFDLQGIQVKSCDVMGQKGSVEIDNTNLPAGTYLYKISTGRSSSEVRKMILIR